MRNREQQRKSAVEQTCNPEEQTAPIRVTPARVFRTRGYTNISFVFMNPVWQLIEEAAKRLSFIFFHFNIEKILLPLATIHLYGINQLKDEKKKQNNQKRK